MQRFLKCITQKHLLATVIEGATEISVSLLSDNLFQNAGKSKIYKYQLLTIGAETYIIWFDIHMNDMHLM